MAESAERRWAGKVAVVTGGASGIGLALARRFAAERMDVALADRDQFGLDDAARNVQTAGAPRVLTAVIDVAREAEIQRLADRVAGELGDVHLLCNNAGVIRPGAAWELGAEDWAAMVDVNLGGVVHGIRAFVPSMLAHGDDCHVVNTASAAGLFSAPSFAGYCTSKAAVIALSEALAVDVAAIPGAKLSVSVLCPGGVATDLFRTEVERRRGDATLSEAAARRWEQFSDPNRTDQMAADDLADQVWSAIQQRSFWIVPMQPSLLDAVRRRLGALAEALAHNEHAAVPSTDSHRIREYYERLDRGHGDATLDLLADDLVFRFARPDGPIEGTRDDLAAYIERRSPLVHRVLRTAASGDVEFALGESVDGTTPLGAFVAAMRADSTGRFDRYLAAFYPDLPLSDTD